VDVRVINVGLCDWKNHMKLSTLGNDCYEVEMAVAAVRVTFSCVGLYCLLLSKVVCSFVVSFGYL